MTDPIGLPPATTTTLTPYCTRADIPAKRLLDSNGAPISDVSIDFAISAATELLYYLSGRRFRAGRSVVRPSQIARSFWAQPFLYPYNAMAGFGTAWGFGAGWAWANIGLGWWAGQDQTEVQLQGPVTTIHSVIVDGITLDPSQYILYDRRRLVRVFDPATGTSGVWPWSQNLATPITEPNTFQIDYEWGVTPGPAGVLACAELAVDLAKAHSGQDGHRLPARVLSIATQGTNTAVGDALEFLKEDLTGIPAVDMWLRAVNPHKRRRRAAIMAPNTISGRSV